MPFRAVIEASGTYRWLYDLLRPHGTVLLAHPLRLRAMIQRRTKTDKLDAQLLANLLRINQIPLAYIPPEPYQRLRDLVRCRTRMGRELAEAKIQLRALLARQNREAPFRVPFGVRGLAWFRSQDFGPIENLVRDELLARMTHFGRQITIFDRTYRRDRRTAFRRRKPCWTSTASALFSALLIVAELGEVERFSHGQTGRRVFRADLPSASVRRPLLPRLDHAARLPLAALDFGPGGDEGDPRRRGVEKLLHAGAEAIRRENRPRGGCQKIGGDLLETVAALAAHARRASGVARKR